MKTKRKLKYLRNASAMAQFPTKTLHLFVTIKAAICNLSLDTSSFCIIIRFYIPSPVPEQRKHKNWPRTNVFGFVSYLIKTLLTVLLRIRSNFEILFEHMELIIIFGNSQCHCTNPLSWYARQQWNVTRAVMHNAECLRRMRHQ